MPRQCQFPVQCSDNRRCYRSGANPGFVLGLALVAGLYGYAGFSQAAPLVKPEVTRNNSITSSFSLSGEFNFPSALNALSALPTLS